MVNVYNNIQELIKTKNKFFTQKFVQKAKINQIKFYLKSVEFHDL